MTTSVPDPPDPPAHPDLPSYPIARECPYRPSTNLTRLGGDAAMVKVRLYNDRVAWLVTGPQQARSLLADRRSSIRPQNPNFPMLNEEMAKVVDTGYADVLFGVDPPEHTRQRRMLIPSFTVKRIATLRPAVERIVTELLTTMLRQGPPGDLVPGFAQPVPSMAMSVLLGVPYAEHELFEKPARELFVPELAEQAWAELTDYLDRLVAAKEAARTSTDRGLLDDLVVEYVHTGATTRAELVAFAMAMLVAGTDTTSNVIALGTLALLDQREQFAALCRRPQLVPGAVDELLRYVSLVEAFARVATEDIDIAGTVIRTGEGILVSSAAANFSPHTTADPQNLDVGRANIHHLAFGYGVHQCLGQHLARLELEVAWRSLTALMPDLRLAAPVEALPTNNDGTVQRLAALPVLW